MKFQDKSVAVRIVGALLSTQRGWGKTECEIESMAGCKGDILLSGLRDLMEKGIVIHKITQEGTSGPYAHRYWLEADVTVSVERIGKGPTASSSE